jgi:2-polyprenyl-3-methyl-5-hydroxy-6-metoxy-1,4-benzoquinol methylase
LLNNSKKNHLKDTNISKIWETIYQKNSWGRYPSEELVRFIARNFYEKKNHANIKFLDLGCGGGSSSLYLSQEGFSVYGIDSSKTAVKKTKLLLKKHNLSGKFQVMDFSELDFLDNTFNCIIDICSLQHNKPIEIAKILHLLKIFLKPDGKFFSIIVGKGTKSELFMNKGFIHYYTKNEIKKLYKQFKIISIEKLIRTENNCKDTIYHWVVHCENKK